jgi:hypothetical protein
MASEPDFRLYGTADREPIAHGAVQDRDPVATLDHRIAPHAQIVLGEIVDEPIAGRCGQWGRAE